MNDSRFMVDHVCVATDKPFEDVAKVLERQLGLFGPDVLESLDESGDTEEAKARIEAMAGPSGFMLFGKTDHGAQDVTPASSARHGNKRSVAVSPNHNDAAEEQRTPLKS